MPRDSAWLLRGSRKRSGGGINSAERVNGKRGVSPDGVGKALLVAHVQADEPTQGCTWITKEKREKNEVKNASARNATMHSHTMLPALRVVAYRQRRDPSSTERFGCWSAACVAQARPRERAVRCCKDRRYDLN